MKARYIIIPLVILGAVALTIWILVRAWDKTPRYEFYSVQRGAVAKTVSVSGSVVSDQKFELGFLSSGIVQTVNVNVGDQVKNGDLLVALDTSVLREQANQARAGIAAASAILNKTRYHLRAEDVNVLNQSLNSAQVALSNAERNLQDAYRSRENEINAAATALNGAESAYQNAVNSYNAKQAMINQGITSAQVALNNASNALMTAQSAYNQVLMAYNIGQATYIELQQAQAALSNANAAYLTTRAAYDSALRQAELERVAAQAALDGVRTQLESARVAYHSAAAGSDIRINTAQNALSAAQAAYNLANAQYRQSLASPHSADVASASAQVASAAASLRMIEAQIAKAYIKAPIDGVVTAVNVKPYELSPMAEPAVVIETKGNYQIEAFVSEVDIEKIVSGAKVRVLVDALPNVEVMGTVAQIDPAATIMLGVVNYKIKVALTEITTDLRSSMTADLEILTDTKEDVLFVPRKVLTRTDGTYQVRVHTGKKVEEREVQVGLLGDSEAEIISGLAEGDQVVLREL